MSGVRTEVLGTSVDVLDLAGAVRRIVELRVRGEGGCVVTPNLDHAVRLREDEVFRAAYDNASLVLADGMPLVWVSRLGDRPLPGRVAGSDLILPLCDSAAAQGLKLFLFGTRFEALCACARRLHRRFPGLEISGVYSPPQGFCLGSAADAEVLEMLALNPADLVLVALGSPKQELWAERWRARLRPAVLVSVGAGLDFIAGTQRRAPPWLGTIGLEWLYRALSNPLRLGPRYLRDLLALPGLLVAHFRRIS